MSILITLNALSAISKLCEFIFTHSETVPPDVTAMTLGVSPFLVSVRYNGTCIPSKCLAEDLLTLFSELQDYGADSLTHINFDRAIALRYDYRLDSSHKVKSIVSEAKDNAQEGSFIRVYLRETEESEKVSPSLIWEGLAKLMDHMDNPPDIQHMSIFLNGERMP